MRSVLATALTILSLSTAPAWAARATDGEAKILFWQAVSSMNPYLSGGSKEVYAASIVIEPLAGFDENGKMFPRLAADIPTLENGGVSADRLSVTWKVKDGLKWSDGSDVTAEDVAFTWRYCTAPGGGCAQRAKFDGVAKVEAVDRLTVKITFDKPTSYVYGPFVGALSPIIQMAQFKDCIGEKAQQCTAANFAPIGTGPFVVKDFKANDVVSFIANQHYRDPAKPAFATLTLKGGGDAAAAARAVLETGEFDFAWNTVIEPEVMDLMLKAGKGRVASAFSTTVERIHLNPFAVDPSLGAKRSTREAGPHPSLSDPAVRRALSLAIDRDILVEAGYGAGGKATCNVIPSPDDFASNGVDWCLKQDIPGANKLLDEAGWEMGGDGIRAKNGVRLAYLFQTSTNSVRQGTQQLVKDWWKEIGVETELRNVPATVYFGSDPASPDTYKKFYADIEMYASGFETTDPAKFLADFRCDKIPSPNDGWQGGNVARFCDPAYDTLIGDLNNASGRAERAVIIKKLNDMLVNSGYVLPIVNRGEPSTIANTLVDAKINPWDTQLWNVENWKRGR